MVKGTLGIVGCPILEDEIVYSLSTEKEEKNLYVVDTPPAGTLKKKLELKGIPFTLIDEWDFNNGYTDIDRDRGYNIVVIMNKLGLHVYPDVLRRTLEEQLRFLQNRFDVIALYYGMCGNAGWDVSKWASASLSAPVFVFRDKNGEVCDDCIGVAVGGHSRYCDFVKKYTGMFFVTPAIAGNWDEYSKELDFSKGFEIMDIHTVKEVFQLYGYKNAVKIDTGIGIKGEEFDNGCKKFSDVTGLEFITAEPGSVDLFPTEKLYNDAKETLNC
ncbi:MAG: DUF1638 domain-containing protein [Methanomassiliicoccaceae archaeon]|nr:DUF1638 domain-containing protein [Methanomassiliicoccaceae archaeon]